MLGNTIDSAVMERGLRELNPDLHFDMATKMNGWHPLQKHRQGVFYYGKHICSMDRGLVPEYKQYSVKERKVPVGWDEADREDVDIQMRVIHATESDYMDALLNLMNGTLGYEMRPDRAIIQYTPVSFRKVRDRVIMVGWRHTFERLIHAQIPGCTREAIASKFNVDMLKFPVGAPQEQIAALLEE